VEWRTAKSKYQKALAGLIAAFKWLVGVHVPTTEQVETVVRDTAEWLRRNNTHLLLISSTPTYTRGRPFNAENLAYPCALLPWSTGGSRYWSFG